MALGSQLEPLPIWSEAIPTVPQLQRRPSDRNLDHESNEDKFMSECRSLTNICGNAVAAVVIAAMEGELNREKFHNALHGKVVESSSV